MTKISSKKLLEIAQLMKDQCGVKDHIVRKHHLKGRAWPITGTIIAPAGRTRRQLYIVAHECAHVLLHKQRTQSQYLREWEAEVYAHKLMDYYGVEVDPMSTEIAKQWVHFKIGQAVRRGAKHIHHKAMEFAGLKNMDTIEDLREYYDVVYQDKQWVLNDIRNKIKTHTIVPENEIE